MAFDGEIKGEKKNDFRNVLGTRFFLFIFYSRRTENSPSRLYSGVFANVQRAIYAVSRQIFVHLEFRYFNALNIKFDIQNVLHFTNRFGIVIILKLYQKIKSVLFVYVHHGHIAVYDYG